MEKPSQIQVSNMGLTRNWWRYQAKGCQLSLKWPPLLIFLGTLPAPYKQFKKENNFNSVFFPSLALEEPLPVLTPEELLVYRRKKLQEKKIQIAALASTILSDPENNVCTIKSALEFGSIKKAKCQLLLLKLLCHSQTKRFFWFNFCVCAFAKRTREAEKALLFFEYQGYGPYDLWI